MQGPNLLISKLRPMKIPALCSAFSKLPFLFLFSFKKPPGNAGFATQETLDAIKRRLLHSIMLEDTFIVVMGGHSAAAGHGNHFQQSYTLQVQRILEPILARLGVYHQSHNFGMGGLGTSQNALASGDIYGKHIDILIWDSGMTEGDGPSKDIFVRQAVLAGHKVPVIWGDVYPLYQEIAPEIGAIFTGHGGKCTMNIVLIVMCTLNVISKHFASLLFIFRYQVHAVLVYHGQHRPNKRTMFRGQHVICNVRMRLEIYVRLQRIMALVGFGEMILIQKSKNGNQAVVLVGILEIECKFFFMN